MILTCAYLTVPIAAEENDDWYEKYKPMVWTIETEGAEDLRLPRPSPQQREDGKAAALVNDTEKILTDLSLNKQELADIALGPGIDMLIRLANFSLCLGDINKNNHLTSQRVYRYFERIQADDTFKNGIPDIGILFQAMLQLNYEGKMIPQYNPVTGELTYRIEKFIDLDVIMKHLRDMDYASIQFLMRYTENMDFMFNELCKRTIKEHMEIIREGVVIMFDYVHALNNSIINKRGERMSYQDPEVNKAMKRIQKHCAGNICYDAIRFLLSYLKYDPAYMQPDNCYISELNYIGDRSRLNPNNPTCWRDQMLMKAGVFQHFIQQGMFLLQVQRQNLYSTSAQWEKSVIDELYSLFIENWQWTLYYADKCLWENQGERVARERMEIHLRKIWDYEDDQLKDLASLPPGSTRHQNMAKVLKMYLDQYHSDYRWKTAIYYTDPKKMKIMDFRGAIFYWLNYRRSSLNILIYGAPMHEYFWGKYNNEYFHEFCAMKEQLRYDLLGLKEKDILGSAKVPMDYYQWRNDVHPPGRA